MDRVDRTRLQVAPALTRYVLSSVFALALACGGSTGSTRGLDQPDTGGASAGGAGGASATAGTGGNGVATGGVKGELSATGGYVVQPSPDDPCNRRWLTDVLSRAVTGGECVYLEDGSPAVDLNVYRRRGTAVLDDEGRIVHFVGTEDEQFWLERFSNERWPCYAGQTFEYACKPRVI